MKNVLFIGSPNAGKSSLFNLLTGEDRKVSNYAGISVDSASACIKGTDINLTDLPGIYSLYPSSIDEMVTISTLFKNNPSIKEYNAIFVIADFSKIETSISLTLQLKKYFSSSVHLIINKSDLIHNFKNINWTKFEESLGVEILTCSALDDKFSNAEKIKNFIINHTTNDHLEINGHLKISNKNLNIINWDKNNIEFSASDEEVVSDLDTFQRRAREIITVSANEKDLFHADLTYKLDKFLIHPFWGMLFFFLTFYLIFHSLYTWSAPLMDSIDSLVTFLGEKSGNQISHPLLRSLIVDGVFAGVGGVIVFLPQIMILFFLLSILEQSGYIARAAFLTDKVMAYFGLNGKAFLPFLSGFACSVPAIMSTRTISDRRERMATLMVLPFITCSARLPVYVLLIGTFIPEKNVFGFLNSRALTLFFLYFLGSIVALIMAKTFRLTFFKGKTNSFFMELPIYQRPKLKIAFNTMKKQGLTFLKKAGTMIFIISLLIWALSTFPRIDSTNISGLSGQEVSSLQLKSSYLGSFGKVIEPVIKPLGFDWKIGIGLLVAFGARELFVSAMSTMLALGDSSESTLPLQESLKNDPAYSFAVACSLLIFFAFACQCMSTLAIVKKETGGYQWPVVMFVIMTFVAYFSSFIVYQFLK